jgi:hypothetical protein
LDDKKVKKEKMVSDETGGLIRKLKEERLNERSEQ